MKKFLMAFITCVSVLAFSVAITLSQESSNYLYAYLSQDQDQNPILHLVDPVTKNSIDVIIPFNYRLFDTFVSPDGEWIALLPEYNPNGSEIVIYHLPSHSMRTIVSNVVYDRHEWITSYLGTLQVVDWSPDSSKIAYIDLGTTSFDVFLYDLQSQLSTNITNDDVNDQVVQWSKDGQSIFTVKSMCGEASCTDFVEKYSGSTYNQTTTLVGTSSNGGVCNFALSPSASHLVYVSDCIVGNLRTKKEISIGSVLSQAIKPLRSHLKIRG